MRKARARSPRSLAFPIRTSPIEPQLENLFGLATETDFHSFTLELYATNQSQPLRERFDRIGWGYQRIHSRSAQNTPTDLYAGRRWAFTPKLALNVSASRTISPPTTVIANAEQSYNASVGLTYQMTPKVAVTAGGSVGYSTGTFTSVTPNLSPFLVSTQNTYNLNTGVIYSMTPFLSAGLNASYSERVSNHSITPQDIVTVSLNYRPY